MSLPANSPPFGVDQHHTRQALVHRLAAKLERTHYPRLALLTIVTTAGLTAFFASFTLLSAGLHSMPVRYGLASVAGYLAFLALVRLWVTRYSEPLFDAPSVDLPLDVDIHHSSGDAFEFGGGGGFSGGGAGRSFESIEAMTDSGGGEGLDLVPEITADESAVVMVPLAFFAVLVVGLVSAVSVVWAAPALLAEVLLDAVIVGAVYRKVKSIPVQHWALGVFRRTWKPMLAIVVTLLIAAAFAQWALPGADSIGDFFATGQR